MSTSDAYRLAIDIGGTFTDIVMVNERTGAMATRKTSSTPDDYARSIADAVTQLLDELGVGPRDIREVVHGTTVATNAILEHKGARTALITTAGFRDVLELARIRVPELYNLFYVKPRPLVPRRLRFEVVERISFGGDVRRPVDGASLTAAVAAIKEHDVDAVAICLLNSYANAAHERVIEEEVRRELPHVFVCCSADVVPEIREYERTSTTVINAYVGPAVRGYLRSLSDRLLAIGIKAPVLVMQSNGGVITAHAACERPAYLIESGPAAGVRAAAAVGTAADCLDVISFDMGGTTAKAATVEHGEIKQTSEYEVGGGINVSSLLVRGGGYALKLPVTDISEIGAGGGSIVWIDPGGRLQIGPQSAGAVPGPVCYDTGGTDPTVTDAMSVLGYLNPAFLAGGSVTLDSGKARTALQSRIAEPLGLSVEDAAHGVYELASNNMVRAVKAVTTFRGRDPRDFVLVAFGGSGPIFAAQMAALLEIQRVIIPPAAGLFSALGLLASPIEYQTSKSMIRTLNSECVEEINAVTSQLIDQTAATLLAQGYDSEQIALTCHADLRYSDQGYELTVPVPHRRLAERDIATLADSFGQEHLSTYGHRADDEPVDLVTVRVRGRIENGRTTAESMRLAVRGVGTTTNNARRARSAYFGTEQGTGLTPVLDRRDLGRDSRPGPLIIEEYDSTTVVPPGWMAAIDTHANIQLNAMERS